jgi:transposase
MDLAKLHLHWRPGKRGKKVYKSYSLARAYREDGKNRKEIVVKLGLLSDKEAEQWRTTLKMHKNPQAVGGVESILSHRSYLDSAALLEAWKFWELDSAFDCEGVATQRKVPLATLASLLTINRCIDPSTKSQVPTWSEKTALPFLLNFEESEINPSRIFRELASIEACKDKIVKHLCKKMMELYPEAMKSLFYDLSTTTFSGTRCLLVEWGHCKEGYDNHIVLALIVNTKGLPIYWEVLEGCTADATTISWLLDRLKNKLSVSIPTMVFDRGMVSSSNLSMIENDKIKYITALDKPQIKSISKMDFSVFSKMTSENVESEIVKHPEFKALDETTYCKELGVINNRRYVLCFNLQLFKDQRQAKEEQLDKLKELVTRENKELLEAKKDRDLTATKKKFCSYTQKLKLNSFVTVKLDEVTILGSIRSYEGRLCINTKKKLEAGQLDGFWVLVTNHVEKNENDFILDTKSVVQPYRDKVVIESSFRDIKSFVEVGPVHVWKEDHVKAHYTICVLSHLLNRTMSLWLHERKGKKTEAIISPQRLYQELEGCKLNQVKSELAGERYAMTTPTSNQKELLERLNMTHLVDHAHIKMLNDLACAG